MNQPETVDGIRIAHTKMGRVHVYTSPDLPGLYVSDRDKMVALRSIKPTIETLISSRGTSGGRSAAFHSRTLSWSGSRQDPHYFSSAAVDVPGPIPTIIRIASSSFAPS